MPRFAIVAAVALAHTVLAGACAQTGGHPTDGPPDLTPDMRRADAGADAEVADAGPPDATPPDAGVLPYVHTIAIDGQNDFAAGDTFATTSAGYTAYVAWDATELYLGYAGPDLDPAALDTGFKWVFVYLDVDPGAATGQAQSLTYNTQRATFPAGFGAEYYYRWKCDASFATLEQYLGGAWMTVSSAIPAARSGSFVEVAIPRAALGAPPVVGIATWMINEKPSFEGSFAGLYAGNFTDGYAADLALTAYLRADFAATLAPNDPMNRRP
jgi:hypothetical protein